MSRADVKTRGRRRREVGTILIAFAFFLLVLIGFVALGVEAGRWFLVRAELSKSVDAASLIAAKNVSNPAFPNHAAVEALGEEFASANFPSGYLGTPASGVGVATFRVTVDPDNNGNGKVAVNGQVSASATLSKIFGYDVIPTSTSGISQKKEVEIMLVLDRSGSMQGTPIAQLKAAAKSFVGYFEETQDTDKMGLVSFATGVTVDRALGTNYVRAMDLAIDNMNSNGYTCTEDALDQADGPSGFTDQTHIPLDQRVQQFLIFFSDGQPTAFRGRFRSGGVDYDAVAAGAINSTSGCDDRTYPTVVTSHSDDRLHLYSPTSGNTITPFSYPTGNGNSSVRCNGYPGTRATTRWYIFDTMPVPGYSATASCIPARNLGGQFCYIASRLALDHAAEMKDNHVTVFAIGLGNVDTDFMEAIASPNLYYHAPDATELRTIFQRVAQEIKLRLVY